MNMFFEEFCRRQRKCQECMRTIPARHISKQADCGECFDQVKPEDKIICDNCISEMQKVACRSKTGNWYCPICGYNQRSTQLKEN
jgi:hypothetical protein